MKITFEVNGAAQTIKRTDDCSPVSDSLNFLECEFRITGMDGCVCTPSFARCGIIHNPSFVQEEVDGVTVVTCTVPPEVIQPPQFDACIYGYDTASSTRITVASCPVWVGKSGYACAPPPPSPTVYEQMIAVSAETKDIAQSVRADADAGVFTPQKGVDYFTDADKVELVQQILDAAPFAEGVSF